MQLVTFQLGEELYGVDIMGVREITRLQEVRAIPNAPAYVEGIINLRGRIIPIINLHRRFNIQRAEIADDDSLLSGFLVIEINEMIIGVMIDKVSRVVSVDPADVHSTPQMLGGIGREYIHGVANEKDGYLIILNVERLFDPKELQQLTVLSG